MKPFAAIAAGVILLSAAPAFAQTAAPSTARETVDPAKLDLARQLMEANGGQKQIESQIDAMNTLIYSKVAESMPKESRGATVAAQTAMRKEMHDLIPPMLDLMARAYAQTFTEQEMRDMLAFQKSPTGQAVLRKTPQLMQRTMTQMMPMIMADMPKVMNHVADAVCDEQHCTPDQRKQIEAAMNAAMQSSAPPRAPIAS